MNKNKYLYLIFLFFIQVLFSFCDNKNELYYEDLPNGELDTTFISKSNNNKSPKKIDTIKVLKVK